MKTDAAKPAAPTRDITGIPRNRPRTGDACHKSGFVNGSNIADRPTKIIGTISIRVVVASTVVKLEDQTAQTLAATIPMNVIVIAAIGTPVRSLTSATLLGNSPSNDQ